MKCKLCGSETEIRNSHIIPEFFYKPLYDDKHRFNVVALNEEQRKKYEQKGIREKLLCDSCEQKLAKYEKYVSEVFYGGEGLYCTNGNPLVIEGIDYNKFKLFQLSLIWRASISKNEFFQNVNLGPHENKIKEMILNENPGSKLKYPCFIMMLLLEGKDTIDALIYPPEMLRYESHRVFRFIFGGAFWLYFISSHTQRLLFADYFLSEEGEIKIPLKKAEETEFFLQLAKQVHKYRMINRISLRS